ncbi:MAG: OsmC family protein [Alphaproteobacteria bacterium]|nr:OsmC family protein [Alphaproteobacteria bacterium]
MGLFNRNEITVTESGEGNFTQSISMGKHIIIADEPEVIGGNDSGPNPYDLLLASLGACTSITLRMYALRKNIPLKGMRISLDHQRVNDEDVIHCILYLEGDLTPTQKEDLHKIAEKCPVHKTLEHPSIIKTTLGTKKD